MLRYALPEPLSPTRSTENATFVSALAGKVGTSSREPPAHHCSVTVPVISTTPLATVGAMVPVPPSSERLPTLNLFVFSGPEKSSEKTTLVT